MISDRANLRDIGAVVVSVIVTVGFIAVLAVWMMRDRTQPNDLLNIMVGALTSNFTTVVQYWLGSSSGSREKDRGMESIDVRHR